MECTEHKNYDIRMNDVIYVHMIILCIDNETAN